jgi:hypothetical protein
VDEEKIKKKYYVRAKQEAKARNDVSWDAEDHAKLVEGEPAPLVSQTRVTAEQILAIGLPDLTRQSLPGQVIVDAEAQALAEAEAEAEAAARAAAEAAEGDDTAVVVAPVVRPKKVDVRLPERPRERAPGVDHLDITAVIDNLLLPEPQKWEAHKRLAQITRNLQALGVLDAEGRQIDGQLIGEVRGMDGVFVWYVSRHGELDAELVAEMVEFMVDHDAIQRIFDRKLQAERRRWILERLREMRRDNPHVTFEDAEAAYEEEHPYEPTRLEQIHAAFAAKLPHPELHGGKRPKEIWAEIAADDLTFVDYVERHDLAEEEGSLFTYLARVMKAAKMLAEVTGVAAFEATERAIRSKLAAVDERVMEGLW